MMCAGRPSSGHALLTHKRLKYAPSLHVVPLQLSAAVGMWHSLQLFCCPLWAGRVHPLQMQSLGLVPLCTFRLPLLHHNSISVMLGVGPLGEGPLTNPLSVCASCLVRAHLYSNLVVAIESDVCVCVCAQQELFGLVRLYHEGASSGHPGGNCNIAVSCELLHCVWKCSQCSLCAAN